MGMVGFGHCDRGDYGYFDFIRKEIRPLHKSRDHVHDPGCGQIDRVFQGRLEKICLEPALPCRRSTWRLGIGPLAQLTRALEIVGSHDAGFTKAGHAISGLSNLQLPSLIAVIGFFIGGLVATHLLFPLIFQS